MAMNTEIFFNGEKAYFDKDEIITGTFALNKVGDLKSRQGISTNTYSLPFVKQNKAIFKDCELISNEGDGAYVKYSHQVYIEGVLVFDGSAFVSESWGTYKVQAVAGGSDFYLLLKNKSLSDLDFTDLDHVRDDATIIASWENTEGFIYPFIDYGKYQDIQSQNIGSDENANIVLPSDLWPAIFLKTLIEKISVFTGYVFKGNVFSDNRFKEEFIPFTTFPFVEQDNGEKFEGSTGTTYINIDQQDLLVNLTTISDVGGNYNSYGFYVNTTSKYVKISLSAIVNPNTDIIISVIKRDAAHPLNTNEVGDGDTILFSGSVTSDLSKIVYLFPGERIFISVDNNSSVFAGSFRISSFMIESTSIDNGYGLAWKWSKNLPKIKLDKFILDFTNRYGLNIDADNDLRIVTFDFEDDILLNEPVDWTGKIDYSNKSQTDNPQVNYRLDNYTQNNLLTYKTADHLTDGFDYTFTIDDEKLSIDIYKDFQSEFSLAPLGSAFLGAVETIDVNMLSIKSPYVFKGLYNNDPASYLINDIISDRAFSDLFVSAATNRYAFYKCLVDHPIAGPLGINSPTEDTNWEILKEGDIWELATGIPLISRINRRESGPIVEFMTESPQEIKVFAKNTDMDWPTIWTNHYQLLKRILVRTKIIQLPLLLNYADIANLDLTRPVFFREFGLYFKVDEVLQFKFNQVDSTLVRLIRI